MPDHVHIVVKLPPTMSAPKTLHILKGASSYDLFRYWYSLGGFGSPGKFYHNVGDADIAIVLEYVNNQRFLRASLYD